MRWHAVFGLPEGEGPRHGLPRTGEVRLAEVRPAEVRPAEVCPAKVRPNEAPQPEVRPGEVRTNVAVLATPHVPRTHALVQQCDVLVVRHRSIPVPIRIFSGMPVVCKAGGRR